MSEVKVAAAAAADGRTLEDILDTIRGLNAASLRLAHRIEAESLAKEDLLATLSSVDIACIRLAIEAEH